MKINLFKINGKVEELHGTSIELEKSLQNLIEQNLETFLGIRFLATEYVTGKVHAGRIDTLGIDENNHPVIIEYKRNLKENVINQGLFYLDWLLDHKADFHLLVQKKLGHVIADAIEWSGARILCIAEDFTKYDTHAVQQIARNIELIRYRQYGRELLLFEQIAAFVEKDNEQPVVLKASEKTKLCRNKYTTIQESLANASAETQELFASIKEYILALGDDVIFGTMKYYFSFRRIKNFSCIEIKPTQNKIVIYLKIDPKSLIIENGFTRDVTNIGHLGTGDFEVTIASRSDFQKAKELIQQSYESC